MSENYYTSRLLKILQNHRSHGTLSLIHFYRNVMSVDPAGDHWDGSGCCSEEVSGRGNAHERRHRVARRGAARRSLIGDLTPLAVRCARALTLAALVLAVAAAEHSKKVELFQEETRKMDEAGLKARSGGLCGGLRREPECGMHDGCSWCVSREEGGASGKEKVPEPASHPGKEKCVPWGQCSWPLSLCELKTSSAGCAAAGKNPGSCTWCSSQSRCVNPKPYTPNPTP